MSGGGTIATYLCASGMGVHITLPHTREADMKEFHLSCRHFLGMACLAALAGCETPPEQPTEALRFQAEPGRPATGSTEEAEPGRSAPGSSAPVIDFSDSAAPQFSNAWQ